MIECVERSETGMLEREPSFPLLQLDHCSGSGEDTTRFAHPIRDNPC